MITVSTLLTDHVSLCLSTLVSTSWRALLEVSLSYCSPSTLHCSPNTLDTCSRISCLLRLRSVLILVWCSWLSAILYELTCTWSFLLSLFRLGKGVTAMSTRWISIVLQLLNVFLVQAKCTDSLSWRRTNGPLQMPDVQQKWHQRT